MWIKLFFARKLSLVLKPRNAYFIATIPDNDNYDKLYWHNYNKYSIPKAFHNWLLIRQLILKVTWNEIKSQKWVQWSYGHYTSKYKTEVHL